MSSLDRFEFHQKADSRNTENYKTEQLYVFVSRAIQKLLATKTAILSSIERPPHWLVHHRQQEPGWDIGEILP